MSIIVQEEFSADVSPLAEIAVRMETRFSMVRDAIINEKSHCDEAVEQFHDVMLEMLECFRVEGADDQPLDERVLASLQQMKPLRDHYFQFVQLIIGSKRNTELHRLNRAFLGQLLAYKHVPRNVIHFNHLWCDHFRFALREIFIGVTALLIANREFEEANRYLEEDYTFETDRGPQRVSYLGFDGYIKSIDEFRIRRLRQKRLSAAADLMKHRADLSFLSFDEMMQADFILCLRGLLHSPQSLRSWCPRTLAHAEAFVKQGFELFLAAQSKREFESIQTLLQVTGKKDLLRRFEQASQVCALIEWKFGGVPIPFTAYMGLDALATR